MRQLKITTSITDRRESPSLSMYLQNLSKIKMISAEEEVELAQQIRAGSVDAKTKLVKANLRFVVSVAKKYTNRGLTLEDLINSGNLGLIEAAGRFDETKGFKFISYAVWWIRASIIQALTDVGTTVRLPLNQRSQLNKYFSFVSDFQSKYEREPTASELMDLYDFDVRKINAALKSSQKPTSFDAFVGPDTDQTILDKYITDDLPPDTKFVSESVKETLLRFIKKLPDRQQYIIIETFGLNGPAKSLDEVAIELKRTRERVRQLQFNALMRLKTFKSELSNHLN